MDPEYTPQLVEYLSALRRRLGLMLHVALPIGLGALILAVALPDVYRSTAVIDIEETKIPGYTESLGRDMSYADQYVAGLTDQVLNKEGLAEIVRKFNPYPELAEDEPTAINRVRLNADVEMITVQVLDQYSGRQRQVITAFSVSYDSRNPETAHRVAAWLTEAYLSADRSRRKLRVSGSAAFFASEAERVRAEISQLESKLAAFKERNAGRLPESTNLNLTVMDRIERDLADVQTELRARRQERIFLAQQLEEAQQIGPDAGLVQQLEAEYNRKATTYDANHPDLISLRRRIDSLRQGGAISSQNTLQAQLQAQHATLAQVRQRYSDDHPDVRRIQRDIDALQRRIAAGEVVDPAASSQTQTVIQLRTQINAIDTQLASYETRGAELRRRLDEMQQRIDATPQAEREYQTLNRDLALARGQYDELIKKQMSDEVRQAAIEGGTADEFRLVQPAYTPTSPAKPERLAIVIMGCLLAAFAAVIVAVIVELLDPKVRGAGDLRRLGVSPLAIFPTIQNTTYRHRKARRITLIAWAYGVAIPLAVGIAYLVAR